VPTLTIPARFTGPPDSANGGVTCGLVARATGLDEVTLRTPPPLETPLRVVGSEVHDGETLVATAAAATVDLVPPAPVGVAEAREATTRYGGLTEHPFPTCFVCGPAKADGLRLFPGPVGDGVAATPWVPADQDPVMVWAALDCPGGWSLDLPGRPMVLGRMALRLDELPQPGEEHVVMGWRVSLEGRKAFTGSALFTAAGELLAVARQTWIAVSP
jgi:hypothetical protein